VTNARPLMRYGAMHEWSCVCQATTVARFISGVDGGDNQPPFLD